MLHIILGILKVIGILLAAIVLLLIGTMLAVLCVPVRYTAAVTKTPQQIAAQIRVTWLLRMISVVFAYDLRGRRQILEIRLFGITLEKLKQFVQDLSDRRRKRREAKRQKQKAKEAKKRKREQEKAAAKKENNEAVPEKYEIQDDIGNESEAAGGTDAEDNIGNESETAGGTDAEDNIGSELEDADGIDIKKEEIDPADRAGISEYDFAEQEKDEAEAEQADPEQTPYLSVWDRIEKIQYKLQALCDTIKKIIQSVKKMVDKIRGFSAQAGTLFHKAEGLLKKVGQIPDKIAELQALLEEYEAKELLDTLWGEIIHLLGCYGPRRAKGYLKFGTGDPAKTGQILGALYLVLPARAAELSIQSEFTEIVFETELQISGRIRANHAAMTAWRLFRNKKLKRAVKRIRQGRRAGTGRARAA